MKKKLSFKDTLTFGVLCLKKIKTYILLRYIFGGLDRKHYLCRKIPENMKLYIKERAKKKSISLMDISKVLELKSYPSFLRTIDNGENLKLKQLQKIAEILDCSIEELMINPEEEIVRDTIVCPYCGKPIKFQKEE